MIPKGLHIGPSPNWYLSNISDCNSNNILAYGAKISICIIDTSGPSPVFLALFVAHNEKVNTVKFCRNVGTSNVLASGGDDGLVKIWDIKDQRCIAHNKESQKFACLEWKGDSSNILFISNGNGFITKWDYLSKSSVHLKSFNKGTINNMSSCVHSPNLLAIGYRGGYITIMDVELDNVLKNFRSFEKDILSLCWSIPQDDQNCLLLATSRDKTIKIWSLDQEKATHILPIPNQQLSQAKWDDSNKIRFYVSGIWVPGSQNLVIGGFPSGEVSMWNLNDPTAGWNVLNSIECGGHVRNIFNIAATPDGNKAFTVSLDRQLVFWDLINKKSSYSLSTLGGYPYCLSFSPFLKNHLAIGGGDGTLRVWNLASSIHACSTFWQGVKGKVITLAWHPIKEEVMAFGTDEGSVGYLDVATNKPPVCSSSFHSDTVYCIIWGPYPFKDETQLENDINSNTLGLYSCGGGNIFVHLASNLQREAQDFDVLVRRYVDQYNRPLQRTEMAWKPDYSALAVGNEDGSIELYSRSLELLARLDGPKKLIQCLGWHPMYIGNSKELSPLHGWLVCSSNDKAIFVYDLASAIENKPNNEGKEKIITEHIRELHGHNFRVVAVDWSPHEEGLLATASYDGTIQVWNVKDNEPIANYQGHKGRVFSVAWSPVNPDIIFSGGEDSTVQQWHVSECTEKKPPCKKAKKLQSQGETQTKKETVVSENKNKVLQHNFGPGGDQPDSYTPNSSVTECEQHISLEDSQQSINDDSNQVLPKATKTSKPKKAETSRKLKKRSYFPLSGNLDCKGKLHGQEDCISLLSNLKNTNRISDDVELLEISPVGSNTEILVKKNSSLNGTSQNNPQSPEDIEFQMPEAKTNSYEETLIGGGSVIPETNGISLVVPFENILDELLHYVDKECGNIVKESLPKQRIRANTNSSVVQPSPEPLPLKADNINIGFFNNNASLRQVLDMEGAHHKENDNFDYYSQMEIWQGNIGNILWEAAEEGKLTDSLLSMAPLGSFKLWREMCELYSQQLVLEGDIHKAVLYQLAVHHVHKAILLFKSHGYFREAIALARSRLPSNDNMIHDLYLAWGNHADREGSYELAAKCYLTLNLTVAAAKVLAKRNDSHSYRVAAYIAKQTHHDVQATKYALVALKEALAKGERHIVELVIAEQPNMKGFLLLEKFHQEVLQHFNKLVAASESLNGSEILETVLNVDYWKHLEEGNFVEIVMQKWRKDGGLKAHLDAELVKSFVLISTHHKNNKEKLLKVCLELFEEIVNASQEGT